MASKWQSLKGRYDETPFDEKVAEARGRYAELTRAGLMSQFAMLDEKKDALQAWIKELNIELEALNTLIRDRFDEDFITSMKSADLGKTFYESVEPQVTILDKEKFAQHVDANPDLEYLWTFNTQQVGTYVKGLLEDAKDAEIPGCLKIYLNRQIRCRRS